MMPDLICLDHIDNPHLRARLAPKARQATCDECGDTGPTVDFELLAEQIDEAFLSNYEPTGFDQSPAAAPIFAEIAGIDSDLAWRIEEHLCDLHQQEAEATDTWNPYDYSQGFRRSGTPPFWQEHGWEGFRTTDRKSEGWGKSGTD